MGSQSLIWSHDRAVTKAMRPLSATHAARETGHESSGACAHDAFPLWAMVTDLDPELLQNWRMALSGVRLQKRDPGLHHADCSDHHRFVCILCHIAVNKQSIRVDFD